MKDSSNKVTVVPNKRTKRKITKEEGPKADKETSKTMEADIKMPLDEVDVKKLNNLLSSKGKLIKKALNVEDLNVVVDDSGVSFPWFQQDLTQEELKVYTRFISSLCKMSKELGRINPNEKENENEKYAFRCFLLRLGYIGKDYKEDRKILLKNLKGSAAFKNKVEEIDHE